MEFYAQISNRKLIAEYDSDNERIKNLKHGVIYRFIVTSPRNVKFHRKFFALLNLCFQNQDRYNNFDHLRGVLIMKAGFYETVVTDKGTIYWPQSISFSNMDETVFEEVYNRVLDQVCIMLDTKEEDIINELLNFM